jgi:hypothetical protein
MRCDVGKVSCHGRQYREFSLYHKHVKYIRLDIANSFNI